MVWRLKGSVSFAYLNHDLFFLEFLFSDEASWVLENGRRSFRGGMLHLKWWNPTVGCVFRRDQAKEAWIRVVGLPLHLWTRDILRRLVDSRGGFVAIDKDTALRTKPMWKRVLVKVKENFRLRTFNILARSRSYEVQIWWEILPWVAEVFSA